MEYLESLLEASEKLDFAIGPEIVRELEVISALSASAAASFDPAAGLNYQRDVETTDIQQKIAVLRLQMQLSSSAQSGNALDVRFRPLGG